jgi:hypothetical protein
MYVLSLLLYCCVYVLFVCCADGVGLVHLSAKGLDIIKAVINVASDNYPGECDCVTISNDILLVIIAAVAAAAAAVLAAAAAAVVVVVVVDDGHA